MPLTTGPGAEIALLRAELLVDSIFGKRVKSPLHFGSRGWQPRITKARVSRPTSKPTGQLPLLAEFLEEQLWALRDRTEALKTVALPEALTVKLAVVADELTDVALLLRRPTQTTRRGAAILLGQMRTMLEAIEREAWPAGLST